MCLICGFIYDEAAGLPDEGIAPGTRWDECGSGKEDFEMIEV
jgi:rubredoxin